VQLASPVEIFSRRKGTAAAVAVARRHRGTQFDPGAEPPLSRRVAGADLDDVLEAMADLVDLKSPYLAGHSREEASLAGEAARVSGQSPKTAANHVEHIYAKLGVSSRAAATLFATQHGLMGAFEPIR
jgi:hypothetical protein